MCKAKAYPLSPDADIDNHNPVVAKLRIKLRLKLKKVLKATERQRLNLEKDGTAMNYIRKTDTAAVAEQQERADPNGRLEHFDSTVMPPPPSGGYGMVWYTRV